MDRAQWRQERRLWNEVQMDTIYARQYDQEWGSYINPSHRQMLERFLDLCPEGGRILDAACGTGKYWPIVLERGFSVLGTDQSRQMLNQAQAKFPTVSVEHVGLQEIAFVDAFDGVICIDAMESAWMHLMASLDAISIGISLKHFQCSCDEFYLTTAPAK